MYENIESKLWKNCFSQVFFVHACLQKKKRNPDVLHNIIYTSYNISSMFVMC